MTLIPTGGIVGTIAKLESESPSAARTLVRLALYESLADQVEDLRHTLAPMVYTAIEDVTKSARGMLLRTAVSKADDEMLDVADGLSIIEKALFGSEKARFEEARRRDARGRFVRTNFAGPDPNVARANPKLSQSTRANEARQEIQRLQGAGLITDKTRIALYTQRRDESGRPSAEHGQPLLTTPAEFETLVEELPEDIELAGMSVRRGDLESMNPKQQSALDLVGLFSGQDLAGSKRILNNMPLDDKGSVKDGTQTAANWNTPSRGGKEQDRQAYNRLKITGRALQSIGAPGSATSIAGGMAELISDLGPEAEKILGPGLRRAAYRYRGTERRPDKIARDTIGESFRAVNSAGDEDDRPTDNPGAAIGRLHRGTGTRDQRRLSSAGDSAVAYFLGLPGNTPLIADRELAAVSAESGEIPPSQGVIIDHEGQIVSQAVGYNGDHYLPFDLRNLGALKGGQYARTRAVGGLTTEDIYTGLLTGARQVQVVSNSGVFTMEFDPTLRGGRRYSDKARRMVQRYQQMLEAIAKPDSKLYERDLSQAEMTEIRRKASAAADTEQEYKTLVERGIEQARIKGGMGSEDDDAEAQEAAEHRAKARMAADINPREYSTGQLSRMLETYVAEELENAGDAGVRRLRLDGAGYDRAMRALQQEFPYFIRRAGWKPLPDWIRQRGIKNPGYGRVGANDRGYVEPGQTNPSLGLQGSNARRKVPTGRTTEADAAPTPSNAAPTTAATTSTSSLSGQQAASPSASKPMSERLMAPGSPLLRQLDRHAAVLVNLAEGLPHISGTIPASATEEDALSASPYQYFNHVASKVKTSTARGREGEAFVMWLLKASPEARNKVLDGMEETEHQMNTVQEYQDQAPAARAAYKEFVDLLSLADPFEKPEGQNPHWAEPNETNPRPYKLGKDDGIPDVGAEDEAFTRARAKLEISRGHKMEVAMADLEGQTPAERGEFVGEAARKINELASAGLDTSELDSELRHLHVAWSYHHAREVSAKLRKLMGGGGADPKAPSVGFGKSGPPRKVILHKMDDPFSRRMRAELGIPEPSSASA